jgi:sulfate adenylyltransferase subunit 1 (EFTu-like GTPase family)
VTILLDDEIDISRGDMIVKSGELPKVSKQIDAMLCWLSEVAARPAPQVPASPYHARQQGDARRHRLTASTSTPWNSRRPSGW